MIPNEYYYRLISLPLFQGLTREDTLNMAGCARFDFRRAKEGEVLVSEGQECRELIFIIQGSITMSERAADGAYTLTEYLEAPLVVQPERLFGRQPNYTRRVTADSDNVQLLIVSKADVRDHLFSFPTFHLNYLNYVCSQPQRHLGQLWTPMPQGLRERFVRFLRERSQYPAGHKRLQVGMSELAGQLLGTRLAVSRMLHQMEDEGLLHHQRSLIDIPSLQQL